MQISDPAKNLMDLSYLERLTDRSIFSEKASNDMIRKAETVLGVDLPEPLKIFLSQYGAVGTRSEFNLFGLGCLESKKPSLIWATRWLKFTSPDLPHNLLPVGTVGWNVFACLELTSPHRVVTWLDGKPLGQQPLETISASYPDFVLNISKELFILDQALVTLIKRVNESDEKYHYDLAGKGKLPRNQDWRVHRFCSRDIILGAIAVKHEKGVNCLLVDLFQPIDLPPFERGGSLIFMTLFMLGDAYRCGGTMEIRFTRNVDGGQAPRKLQALAKSLGAAIKPESLQENKLDPDDATRLYAALTGFSEATKKRIDQININPLKACFVIHRGIWSKPEVEMLLLHSSFPDRILNGGSSAENWFEHQEDLLYSRNAVLSSYLTRAISRREKTGDMADQADVEDDINEVSVGFLEKSPALVYMIDAPESGPRDAIRIPWLLPGTSDHVEISAGDKFLVLVRARNRSEFKAWFDTDLESAGELAKNSSQPVYLLVPRDFLDVQLDHLRPAWMAKAAGQNTGVIVCGEDTFTLDEEVSRRWRASRIMRD